MWASKQALQVHIYAENHSFIDIHHINFPISDICMWLYSPLTQPSQNEWHSILYFVLVLAFIFPCFTCTFCLFVCLKWAEQYIWSFFWCGIAACIWWFHGDWGMVTLHVLQHMKPKAAKQWRSGRLINGLKKVRGNEEEALQTMWRSQRMILPILYYQMSNNSFDSPQMDLWMSYRENKIMSTQLLLQFYEIDNVCRKKCTPDFIYSPQGM